MPTIDRQKGAQRARLITAGVGFFNENDEMIDSMAITDRCNIERNGYYIGSLPKKYRDMRFLEMDSQIVVELDNKKEEPVVRFKHYRHGKMVNRKGMQYPLKGFVQTEKSYAKMYIQQFYGKGNYHIRETRKSRRDLRINKKRRSSRSQSRKLKKAHTLRMAHSPQTQESHAVSPSSILTKTMSRRQAIGGRKKYRASI